MQLTPYFIAFSISEKPDRVNPLQNGKIVLKKLKKCGFSVIARIVQRQNLQFWKRSTVCFEKNTQKIVNLF